jgi:SHS2 domain-containing protein
MAGFRTIEHTADIGIEAWGAALDEVYEAAALGMTYLMADAERIEPRVSRDISVSAGDLEELMFAWLNELLFIIDADGLLLCEFEVTVEDTSLEAVVRGEPIDPGKHGLKIDIKAATYHDLTVERDDTGEQEGWTARIIFDV